MTLTSDTGPKSLAPLLDALYRQGWCVLPDLLEPALCLALNEEIAACDNGALSQAGIGRAGDHMLNRDIRRDRIHWLDGGSAAQRALQAWMEELRLAVNRRLFLGLWDYECHFSRYPPGAFYRKHVDAFAGRGNRMLTTVLYLNPDWQDADGGELVIYHPDAPDQEMMRVQPRLGTLVVFLSERFYHEVLPAARSRHSIAGWFRINNTLGGRLDPAR